MYIIFKCFLLLNEFKNTHKNSTTEANWCKLFKTIKLICTIPIKNYKYGMIYGSIQSKIKARKTKSKNLQSNEGNSKVHTKEK